MDKELARKKHIFRTLASFESEDEAFEQTLYQRKLRLEEPKEASELGVKPPRHRSTHANVPSEVMPSPPVNGRSKSDKPSPLGPPKTLTRRATEPAQTETITVDDVPARESLTRLRMPGLRHSVSSRAPSNAKIPPLVGAIPRPTTASGKRKRDYKVDQVPEGERYFKGCVFYFFPASDVNKTRRFMITKAIAHGAIWAKDWHPGITHIVMDTGLSKGDLFKHTPLTETPTKAVAVDQTYISECLENRALINPSYYQGLIPGFESVLDNTSPSKSSSAPSSRSLPVKSAEANGTIGNELIEEVTPPRSEEEKEEGVPQSSAIRKRLSQLTHSPQAPLRPQASSNALDEAIVEAKGTAGLLIDSDDEDDSRPTSSRSARSGSDEQAAPRSSRPGSSSSRPSRPGSSKSLTEPNVLAWQHKFTCMQPATSKDNPTTNPNAPVIELLEQMASYYDSVNDQWRTRACRIAISALKKHPHEVTTAAEASKIRGIGTRLAAKIEEIRWTSRLRRLENVLLEPGDKALKLFIGIYGVGPALAGTWAQRGYRSLADIEKHVPNLTSNQRVGMDHYNDFATRIPRAEVAEHGSIVTRAIQKIDPAFSVTVGGSYRRGAATSGDIDLLISHPTNTIHYTRAVVLDTLIPRLTQSGYLVAALATTDKSDGTKWHGACQFPHTTTKPTRNDPPNPWRRIDLLLVPSHELGAALLYFTGNDIFNRSMRLLARRKGMRLNQRGLYKDVMRSGVAKLNEGTKVAGEREEDIFAWLGVPWREVGERDC